MKRVIAACLFLAACDKPVTYEPPREQRTADVEHRSLDEAKELAAKGDLDGAHGKLSQIKLDSPLRTTTEFTDIQDKWAREQLQRADKETDKTRKLAMLDAVAKEPNVNGAIRAEANEKLEKANPAPAIPPPTGPGYDPKESAERLAKANELGRQHKMSEAKSLLLGPALQGRASPQEKSLLLSLCMQGKDNACLVQLADAGVEIPAVPTTPPKGK